MREKCIFLFQEFYRFVPNDRPKHQIFPQPGIKVDVSILMILIKGDSQCRGH